MNSKIRRIHMVGIGGAGMSGIAEVLLDLGYEISGSDIGDSAVVRRLRDIGVKVAVGHAAENVGNVQVLVMSTAIDKDNPELVEARRRNIPIIPRAEMLAELMRLRQGVAVAGTHGKTTTTSLTASIFDAAGRDPTVIIGGRLNVYGTNARLGHGEYLIAEADESDGSFLCLLPIINIVTNIDEDHLDYYRTRDAIDAAFVKFMNNVPFYGVNVVCGDDAGVRSLLPHVKRPVLTYGFNEENSLRAVPLESGRRSHFEVWRDGEKLGEVSLPQPGRHNILNALGAIGAAMTADISFENCVEGLNAFSGVARRFEFKGEKNGVTVVDDYGHHPAEIAVTLSTARQVFPGRRIVVAFQPHRFSRTKNHFGEFCKVFDGVDQVLLTEIYAASEKPIPGVSGQSLAQGIQQISVTPVQYYQTLEIMAEALDEALKPGDVLLTMGAGTITRLGPLFLEGKEYA
ncbi:MAG: UDP-N-acetylmuramate--L-alanine ligase [Desulfovibrio sp.]|jgi:UDP-N-acetylmuramate--alanine ligase|nr:UDP-N-acetylmuramate--L-alanine ligase [Desulfovibrio sp.]